MARTFTHSTATRTDVPLLIGITGASSSGKTYSALELAVGVQSVRPGPIFVVDTEGGRARHYSDKFTFEHVPFAPPFGPLDYKAAIDYCVSKGARIVVVDSMSHEHDGDGGVLDQIDDYLEKKAGDNWEKRDRLKFAAQIKPKAERKELNQRILQLTDVTFIFCYRAHEKIRLTKGKDPEKGWAPISTSPLFFDMTLRLLLPPGSDGRPLFFPQDEGEKLLTKLPYQFREWFKAGDQLNAEIGRKLALWAKGGDASGSPALLPPPAPASPPARVATGISVTSHVTFTGTVKNVKDRPKSATKPASFCITASDGHDYWTTDATIADRARVAGEVDAEMKFTYHADEKARYLDGFEIAPEKEG